MKSRVVASDKDAWNHVWLLYANSLTFTILGVLVGWLLMPDGVSLVWGSLGYALSVGVFSGIGLLILAYIDIRI